MFINLVIYYRIFVNLFKTASIRFLSYILLELLDVEHGSPICYMPGVTRNKFRKPKFAIWKVSKKHF